MCDPALVGTVTSRPRFVGAGGVAVAPRGVPHAFLVLSASAKILFLHTPGCCEAFYWGASEPMPADDADGTPGVVDFDRVRASAQAHDGIVLLGPPPFGDSGAGQPGDG